MTGLPNREGLQPERTALAWQRTAITANVVLLPVLAVDARIGAWWLLAAGCLAAMAGSVLTVGVHARFAQLLDDSRGYSPYPPMVRVAAVTVLGAAGGTGAALALLLR